MIVYLHAKEPFAMKITGRDGSTEYHEATQRPFEPDGTRMDDDWAITITGSNSFWNIEIIQKDAVVEDQVARLDAQFAKLDQIEESYEKHFGRIRPVTERK